MVVGLALRRICERIPCAQMKERFARLFALARQLGVAVSSGIEIAYRTVTMALDHFIAMADGDVEAMPMALAFDYVNRFCHAQRGRLLRTTHDVFPSLLRYLWGCYATAGRIVATSNGKVAAEWEDMQMVFGKVGPSAMQPSACLFGIGCLRCTLA